MEQKYQVMMVSSTLFFFGQFQGYSVLGYCTCNGRCNGQMVSMLDSRPNVSVTTVQWLSLCLGHCIVLLALIVPISSQVNKWVQAFLLLAQPCIDQQYIQGGWRGSRNIAILQFINDTEIWISSIWRSDELLGPM